MIRADETLYGGASDSIFYLLYDLEKDPTESRNLLNDHPEIANELISDIEAWYDNVLKGGRAFNQPVYEVGHWEDASSAINLDGFQDVWGSVADHNRTSFRIGNWTTSGSGINYEIDVVEEGNYLVELGYTCAPTNLGSEFIVYTEFDTVSMVINDERSAFSDTLFFPAGEQSLAIELAKLGAGPVALDYLSKIIVHRIPDNDDNRILKNVRIQMETKDSEKRNFYQTSASTDFMLGEPQIESLKILKGEELNIQVFADNTDQLDNVILYVDFDHIESISQPPYNFSYIPNQSGRFTINVEFISKAGIVNAVHGDILVE
jgi:hypothetical protein